MSEPAPQAAQHSPRHVYDRLAAVYERVMRPLERLGLARLRASALREMPAGANVLEVGTGTGLNFSFYPSGATGAATELSGEMIGIARRKRERPAGVRLVRCRAEELPFADDSFDAALATLVFCSVNDPARAFAELRRVVRRGGTVVLLEHVRPPGALLGRVFDALSFFTTRLCEDHFNRRTLEAATRAGLVPAKVEGWLRGAVQLIVLRVK